jgi:hypothetical protein
MAGTFGSGGMGVAGTWASPPGQVKANMAHSASAVAVRCFDGFLLDGKRLADKIGGGARVVGVVFNLDWELGSRMLNGCGAETFRLLQDS